MTLGQRLKEERTRLGLSQEAMAIACGTGKRQQIKYEQDAQSPGAQYLAALCLAGVDVAYVLSARHAGETSPDESVLLAAYRNASPELRRASLAVLGVAAVAQPAAASFVGVAGDNHGQIVQGGTLQQDHVEFHVGPKKRGLRKT